MAILTITPVVKTDIAAEFAARGYTQAVAPAPVQHHYIPPPVEPGPYHPILPPEPTPEPTPEPPPPHDLVEHHAPVIHIPRIGDHYSFEHEPPEFHIPPEHHAPPDLPDIHIPVEALEPTGWRKYKDWLPLVVLLAREKDILDMRR